MKLIFNLEDMFNYGEEKEVTLVLAGGQLCIYLDEKNLDDDPNAVLELVEGKVKFVAFKDGEINPYVDQTIY